MPSAKNLGSILLPKLNGTPVLLGTITLSTTSGSNNDATAFNNTGDGLAGKVLLLQPDIACHIFTAATAATATATTSHVRLEANEKFVIVMQESAKFLASRSVSGTGSLRVYELA